MAFGDTATGTKRLETMIDFHSEEFKKAWDAARGEMLRLGTTSPPALSQVAYPVLMEAVLQSAVEHTALEAFAKTDMRGEGWSWNFYIEDIPTDVVEALRVVNSKIRIASIAHWRSSDAGEHGNFLTVNIGDFVITPVSVRHLEERK